MGLFKKNASVKKGVYTKNVMHQDGLSNIPNDVIIRIVIDEIQKCIRFSEAKKEGNSATLDFSKITHLKTGERGNTVANSSIGGAITGAVIGGTTGAVIGATAGKKSAFTPTLTIYYKTEDEEKEINLYQCNYNSEGSINFVKNLIEHNLPRCETTHIDL